MATASSKSLAVSPSIVKQSWSLRSTLSLISFSVTFSGIFSASSKTSGGNSTGRSNFLIMSSMSNFAPFLPKFSITLPTGPLVSEGYETISTTT